MSIALRPQSIQRASSLAGTLPNPHIAFYNLTAFYGGGERGYTDYPTLNATAETA